MESLGHRMVLAAAPCSSAKTEGAAETHIPRSELHSGRRGVPVMDRACCRLICMRLNCFERFCRILGSHDNQTCRAVDRVAVSRDKWDGCSYSALCTQHVGLRAIGNAHSGLASGSALWAPGGYVDELLFVIEDLLTDCPDKWGGAFPTGKGLVTILHAQGS